MFAYIYVFVGCPEMAIGRANFLTIYGLEITKSRRREWDGKSLIVIGGSGHRLYMLRCAYMVERCQ